MKLLNLYIGDFGEAKHLSKDDMYTSLHGTSGFIAPEILVKLEYDLSADVWSYGVTLAYVCLKKDPFPFLTSKLFSKNQDNMDIMKELHNTVENEKVTLRRDLSLQLASKEHAFFNLYAKGTSN